MLNGKTFLDNKSRRQIKGIGARDGKVVHRSIHSEFPYIATREKKRRDDIGVGCEGQSPEVRRRTNIEYRRIPKTLHAEGWTEILSDQLMHHFAAASVAQQYPIHNMPRGGCPLSLHMRNSSLEKIYPGFPVFHSLRYSESVDPATCRFADKRGDCPYLRTKRSGVVEWGLSPPRL